MRTNAYHVENVREHVRWMLNITKSTTHRECIKCGECIKACPTDALSTLIVSKQISKRKEVLSNEKEC